MLSLRGSHEKIEVKIKRLQEIKEEVLVYPLTDYFKRFKLNYREEQAFVRGIVRHFKKAIRFYIGKGLDRFDMRQDFRIKDISSIEESPCLGFEGKTGLSLKVVGHQSSFGKGYLLLERWL